MVGAVLVRDGVILGLGHHRRFGGLHAEREALADCRRRGNDPRGSTAFVTLEPCCHHGKQPPCTDALIEAGVARVVYARPDPHGTSGGGAEVLRRGGVACGLCQDSPLATRMSDPFVKRVTTGLPWVIAKWAQTPDGRLVTRADEPRWISNELSLKRVHRLRARVDAIVTGIGTVLADDPLLTARGVRRLRRVARRVVIDARGRVPDGCRLVRSAEQGPVVLVRLDRTEASSAMQSPERKRRVSDHSHAPGRYTPSPALGAPGGIGIPKGVEELPVPGDRGRINLAAMLRLLADRYDMTNVVLECGPTLLEAFSAAGLVDEAFVYVAPPAGGELRGTGREIPLGPPADWLRSLAFVRNKPLAGDTECWYRRAPRRG